MTADGSRAVNPPLRSSRLDLEPLVLGHAHAFFEGMREPAMFRYCFGFRPKSIEETAERIKRWETRCSPDRNAAWLNWMARIRDGAYVGWFQATLTGSTAVIGYDVFVPHQRQGYGREGAAALIEYLKTLADLRQIEAIVDSENVASIRLVESLQFVRVLERSSDDMPGRRDVVYRRER